MAVGAGAGVGGGAGRTQELGELLPTQQEAPAAGSLGPRRRGPRGGRQGTLGVEPGQPSKAASKKLGLFTFFCSFLCPDPWATGKTH